MMRTVHLGFEVGSVAAVKVPIRHMAVTGQTQESGKTTALEALISRSGLTAIAFLTKRGESSFAGAVRVPAYFHERADWQFVESILESTMKQRMKFERAWIVKACKGAHTLADVQRNITELQARSKRSMDQDLYMLLGEYLTRVVPQIRALRKSTYVGIVDGSLTVMDLVDYPDELQMLVISSTLEWIHKLASNTIIVIPEAWKFIPQGRNTPVKIVAEKLAREGAALRNYLWVDSQDMAAVDKLILRACAVWLIGVQREANEIKRALANMPAGMKKPNAAEVATLELGQFFACSGREIRKTYVQPAWMNDTTAADVAVGSLDVHQAAQIPTAPAVHPVPEQITEPVAGIGEEEDEMEWKEKYEQSERARRNLEAELASLRKEFWALRDKQAAAGANGSAPVSPELVVSSEPDPAPSEQRLVQAVLSEIRRNPVLIKLSQEFPVIEVKVNRTVMNLDDSSLKGKIALLIHQGWFSTPRSFADVKKELIRRGIDSRTGNVIVGNALKSFVETGFFFSTGDGYELQPGADRRVAAQ